MTLKKLSAALTLSAIFFCARLAHADEAYILTVPETFSVTTNGWNLIGQLQVQKNGDNSFDTTKKLVVTASSENNFALKLDDSNSIAYTLKAAEGDESQTDTWEFTATEINAGTSKDIGIYITWGSTQAAGNYSDTLTYTAEVYSLLTRITDFAYFDSIRNGESETVSPRAKEISADEAKALAVYQAGKTGEYCYLFYGIKTETDGTLTLLFTSSYGLDIELANDATLSLESALVYIVNE